MMRNNLRLLGALVVALTLCANSAMAQNTRADIEAACKKVCQLYAKKDFKGVAAMMTDDAKFVNNGQTFGKAEWLQQSEMMGPQMRNIKMSFKIVQFNAKGSTVNAVIDWSMSAEATGPDGKPTKFSMTERSKDTFVKKGNKWFLKESVTVKQTMK